ncbi:MAG: membrane protein insertase YidC [Acidobacteriia bacterium]|nr:membrane protein insertase YidC [Terriglobia bacterium]
MEKRAVIAIALSFIVLLGWYWLFPAPKPSAPATPPVAGSRAAPAPVAPAAPKPAEPTAVAAASEPGPTARAVAAEKAETIRVETAVCEVVLTNKGGRVLSWRLKGYSDSADQPVELVPAYAERDDLLPLGLDLDDAALAKSLNGALFSVERTPLPASSAAPGERIRFSWADGKGIEAEKVLVFRKDDYLADLSIAVTDRGRPLPARVTWGPGFEARDPSQGSRQLHYIGQAVVDIGGVVSRTARGRIKQDVTIPESGALRWAGLEEQFFAALVMPAGGRGGALIRQIGVVPERSASSATDSKEAKPEPQLVMAVGVPSEGARLYVGPKKYTLLRKLGGDLDAVVWFSSYRPIYWLAKYLFLALLWVHDHVAPNYGLAIILATVALRLVFFPLNQYSMVNMRKMQSQMQRIQPKINAIKAKYKKMKDAQGRAKMNEEMMALYRKEGVNPMGGMSGCLPMLVQFPILIAFYNMLTVAVELRSAPFVGWIRDLTLKDPFYVTPILMGATMFLQQKMTTTKAGDPMQQRMMTMMPVVFTVMFLNLPSGLVLYWFVNNLLGIGQQWLVNRHIGRLEAAAQKA